MKTLRITALTALLLTLATGAAPLLTITDKNDGQAIKISVGQPFEVRLPSNPTTGYQWTAGALHTGPLTETHAPTFQPSTSGLLGAGGTQVFAYRGVATGTAHLSFGYARSWEHTAPIKHIAITIVVLSGAHT
jgi:inhibitor of cysteine peptidase